MGNCHFKTEFESENVTGNYYSALHIFKLIFHCSIDKAELQLHVLHWQGRLWQSMEGGAQEVQAAIRNERDV
jgi:hypothetical protein